LVLQGRLVQDGSLRWITPLDIDEGLCDE
jgi:hypothetical protein